MPCRSARRWPPTRGDGSFTVYLGVPRFELGRPNSRPWNSPDASNIHRYVPREREIADENTGDGKQTIRFRHINAMLLLDGQSRADMEEVIPVLKVSCGTGPGAPQADPAYVPPCVLVSGSEPLRSLIAELDHQVQAIRRRLAVTIGVRLHDRRRPGARLEQLLRLATLNRFAVRLTPLWRQRSVTPRRAMQDPEIRKSFPPDMWAELQESFRNFEGLPYFQTTDRQQFFGDASIEQWIKAGAVIGMGTDNGTPLNFHADALWREAKVFVDHGMSPERTISALTRVGARIIGKGNELGTIERGKLADIIVVQGDPLFDIAASLSNVNIVMKDGVIYKGAGAGK